MTDKDITDAPSVLSPSNKQQSSNERRRGVAGGAEILWQYLLLLKIAVVVNCRLRFVLLPPVGLGNLLWEEGFSVIKFRLKFAHVPYFGNQIPVEEQL